MQVIFDSIENVKAKPHHVRRQVTFVIAGGIAALIGLVWLVGSLATGAFALKPSSFADVGALQGSTDSTFSSDQVAGAGAATGGAVPSDAIIVVDAPKTPQKAAEQTVIPF